MDQLLNACHGKTLSNGGLNLKEFTDFPITNIKLTD